MRENESGWCSDSERLLGRCGMTPPIPVFDPHADERIRPRSSWSTATQRRDGLGLVPVPPVRNSLNGSPTMPPPCSRDWVASGNPEMIDRSRGSRHE
jgi:hypothetical protein